MNPPIPGWTAIRTTVSVHIPTLDGESTAQVIPLEVDAWQDAEGEIYLTGEAEEQMDALKARHLGLITPADLKHLRKSLGLSQKELAQLLQLGEKTCPRWENGRERPSRSLNVLLHALMDGRIDPNYLRSVHPDFKGQSKIVSFKAYNKTTLPEKFPTWQSSRPPTSVPCPDESTAIPA